MLAGVSQLPANNNGSVSTNDIRLSLQLHHRILFRSLHCAASNWEAIGTLLGLKYPLLKNIEKDEEKVHSRLNAMLHLWLKETDPPPTKSKIIGELKFLGLNEEAKNLEKDLM